MAYEDIYNGLTDKEKEKMLKADIPKFRVVRDANLSKEELEQAERDLDKIIKKLQKQVKTSVS